VGPLLRALAVLVVAAALAAAGCEDGGDAVEPVPPAERVERSAVAAAGLRSFHLAFTAEGELAGAPAALGPLAGALAAEGEGDVAPPDRASIDATVRSAGLAVQLNVTRAGPELAVSVFGTTAGIDVPPDDLERLDLGALLPTLAGWVTDPVEEGTEEVDGADTVRIRGRLDPDRVVADLAPFLGTVAPEDRDALAAALADDAVVLWIGAEDDLPRRVRLSLDAEGAEAAAAGIEAVRIDATLELSGFGEPVEIEDPDPDLTLDPESLRDLLPG